MRGVRRTDRASPRARRSRVDGVKRCVCERFVFWRGILGHFAGKCLETFLLCLDIDAPKIQANVAPNIGDKCVQGKRGHAQHEGQQHLSTSACSLSEPTRNLLSPQSSQDFTLGIGSNTPPSPKAKQWCNTAKHMCNKHARCESTARVQCEHDWWRSHTP